MPFCNSTDKTRQLSSERKATFTFTTQSIWLSYSSINFPFPTRGLSAIWASYFPFDDWHFWTCSIPQPLGLQLCSGAGSCLWLTIVVLYCSISSSTSTETLFRGLKTVLCVAALSSMLVFHHFSLWKKQEDISWKDEINAIPK